LEALKKIAQLGQIGGLGATSSNSIAGRICAKKWLSGILTPDNAKGTLSEKS
jgi:hypothetical protein